MEEVYIGLAAVTGVYLYSKGKSWIVRAVFRNIHSFLSHVISLQRTIFGANKKYLLSPQAEAFEAIFRFNKKLQKSSLTVKDFRDVLDSKLWEPIYDPKTLKVQRLQINGVTVLKINSSITNISQKDLSHDKSCILHFHGGAFVAGDAQSYANFCRKLSERCGNVPVFSVEYSLCPEHSLTQAVAECVSVFEGLQKNPELGYETVVIVGDSAGGGMALAVLQSLQRKDPGEVASPIGVVLIGPCCDFTLTGSSIKDNVATDSLLVPQLFDLMKNSIPECKEQGHKGFLFESCDFSRLGDLKFYICASKSEMLYSDAERLMRKIQEENEGNKVALMFDPGDSVPHIFPIFSDFAPEYENGLKKVVSFINSLWKKTNLVPS